MLRPYLAWASDTTDPRVASIVGNSIGIDTHNHIDVPLTVDHVCIGTDTKLTQPSPRPAGPPPVGPRPAGLGSGPPSGFRSGQMHAQIGERTNLAWADQIAGFYYVVVNAMLKTGFSPGEIGKIGGANYLRIFGEAVKG